MSLNRIKDMTKGEPARLLLLFALPLMLGNLGQQFYMIVDAIIVGRGVGVEALAAVGATDWTYWLVLWVLQALAQGFSIRISQYFGEGDSARLKKAFTMSVVLCFGTGLLMTAVGLGMVSPMLRILKTPETILGGASQYLYVLFSGTIIVMAYNMASSILRAFGDGKTPLIAMGIAACTNIVLDLLFVLVFRWGITGAAAATVLAQLVAFLYCLLVLRQIDLIKTVRKDWDWDKDVVKRLCEMGVPLALQHVLIAVGGMILQSAINSQGFVFVAGFTATNKIYGLLESSAISMGYAITTYMAQNYGAKLYQRIHKGMRAALVIGLTMSACISVVMIAGGKYILQLFVSSSDAYAGQVLDTAYHYLFIMSLLLAFLYLLYVCRSALQGLGDAMAPMLSGVMEFIMRVAAALVFTRIWGSSAIFFAEPFAWAGAAALLMAACWRTMKRIPPGQEQ